MFSWIYQGLLALYVLVLTPQVLWQMAFRGKYRKSFLRRFGWGMPEVPRDGRRVLWIHAVSVGEVRAVAPLALRLQEALGEVRLVLSTTTETGFEEGKRALPFADTRLYLPLDFKILSKRLVKRLRPDWFVLCETDFWYHHLGALKERGVPTILVNGKLSDASLRHFSRFPWLAKRLFQKVDLFCVQSQEYARRFSSLGVSSERVVATGNLKFDEVAAPLSDEALADFRQHLGFQPQEWAVTLGSTHAPEEVELVARLIPLLEEFPEMKVLVVPRHPERFGEVERLLRKEVPLLGRYSQGVNPEARVVLVDAMGVLRSCYQLSRVAVMGGSFAPVGGHNALEAVALGVPVVMGPHMFAQEEMARLILQGKTGVQTDLEGTSEAVAGWLRGELSFASSECSFCGGVVERTLQVILEKNEKSGQEGCLKNTVSGTFRTSEAH